MITQGQLQQIIDTNEFPPNLNLEELWAHPTLGSWAFKHRFQPAVIAAKFLQERDGEDEDTNLKVERIRLKQQELELKKQKQEGLTQGLTNIYKILQRIEDVQKAHQQTLEELTKLLTKE